MAIKKAVMVLGGFIACAFNPLSIFFGNSPTDFFLSSGLTYLAFGALLSALAPRAGRLEATRFQFSAGELFLGLLLGIIVYAAFSVSVMGKISLPQAIGVDRTSVLALAYGLCLMLALWAADVLFHGELTQFARTLLLVAFVMSPLFAYGLARPFVPGAVGVTASLAAAGIFLLNNFFMAFLVCLAMVITGEIWVSWGLILSSTLAIYLANPAVGGKVLQGTGELLMPDFSAGLANDPFLVLTCLILSLSLLKLFNADFSIGLVEQGRLKPPGK